MHFCESLSIKNHYLPDAVMRDKMETIGNATVKVNFPTVALMETPYIVYKCYLTR